MSSRLHKHLFHTDIHSTFRICCLGKVFVKHHDGQGCASSRSSSQWPFTSQLCWPRPSAAGSPHGGVVGEGNTHSSVDPRQLTTKGQVSLNGAELQARDGIVWHAWELLPSLSDSTRTRHAKLQPAPRVTP